MVEKKKLLFVTQELDPYTAITEVSEVVKKLPEYAQSNGMEIRVLMPRYGVINERRHRLHEVVRLSGMNIIVDDDDYPLIIKVASLPGARLQVYFLDNDDFFKRKSGFADEQGNPYEDNPDRMIFFCKGVIETVRKFGWPPDIIHCHGWMTSLIPMYIREAYKTEPLFQNSKIIYSAYDTMMDSYFSDAFIEKASINNLGRANLDAYLNGNDVFLHKGAITYADAIIRGSEQLPEAVEQLIIESGKPSLAFHSEEEMLPAYMEFYNSMLVEEEAI
ncbi:MAG: glycogen/starch synthase [Saprospiraceae bacterium]|jgi:starch synthase|nr:glycogen/starch synthase [Saprospiraceae bacterium]